MEIIAVNVYVANQTKSLKTFKILLNILQVFLGGGGRGGNIYI